MSLNLLDQIPAEDIIAFARAVPVRTDFLLTASVVPFRQVNGVKWKVRNSSTKVSAAKFRAFDAETPMGRRQVTHSFTEGYLPPLGVKLVLNELESILLDMARGTDPAGLLDSVYDDVQSGVLAVYSRLELAAGDFLTDGKFTLNENGVTLEADFGFAANHKPTAGTLWSDTANATPLTNEMAWRQQLIDDGAGPHGRVVTSNTVLSYLAQNKEYRAAFYGQDVAGTVGSTILNAAQVNGVRANYGLPAIEVYDVANIDVDGTATRPLAANKFLMLPSDARSFAETQVGITAEALALSRASNPRITLNQAPGIIAVVNEDGDPVRVTTKVGAVGMPVCYDVTKIISATVAA